MAKDSGLLNPKYLNPHSLLALSFDGPDPLNDDARFGAAGRPTTGFENWIRNRLSSVEDAPIFIRLKRELLAPQQLKFPSSGSDSSCHVVPGYVQKHDVKSQVSRTAIT